jgi:hypothetical protein
LASKLVYCPAPLANSTWPSFIYTRIWAGGPCKIPDMGFQHVARNVGGRDLAPTACK